jgi:hypothetical protein
MICIVDGQACDQPVTHRFCWAWGEEGVCCDTHRGILETRATQLQRSILFSALREYTPPELRVLAPEVAELKLQNGALKLEIKRANDTITLQAARIQELETCLRDADTPAE